jgi:flagellar motor switch protein FliG
MGRLCATGPFVQEFGSQHEGNQDVAGRKATPPGLRDVESSEEGTLAQKIIDEIFTFDKLVELDDRAIRLLLKEIDSQALVIALKVAPPALRQKFMANMSRRAADLLSEEMEARGSVRLSEVEAQQRKILQVARGLAESGAIALGVKPGDAYL